MMRSRRLVSITPRLSRSVDEARASGRRTEGARTPGRDPDASFVTVLHCVRRCVGSPFVTGDGSASGMGI